MAKIIKITTDFIEEIRKDFEDAVKTMKLSNGRFSFSKSFASIKRDAKVVFKKQAWDKMQGLIKGFSEEVAWHGVAYRGPDGTDEYYITDILVYPQEVTGATVTTDQEKYQTWLMSHDDEVFNNIRMQGHSHVNMGVTPSGVDNNLYESILEQLGEDMFYIFLIYNKKGDKTFKIYDLKKNVLFETTDVKVEVEDDGEQEIRIDGVSDDEKKIMIDALNTHRTNDFVKKARDMVKRKQYNYNNSSYYPAKTYTPNQSACSGGAKTPAVTTPTYTKPATTPATTQSTTQATKQPENKQPAAAPTPVSTPNNTKDGSTGVRMGKRSGVKGLFGAKNNTQNNKYASGFNPLKSLKS